MGFCSEFKEFAVRGNVVDMAVGVVIGGAFGKIVTSFVNDIVMPPLGKLVGDVDFSNLYINLTDKQFANLAEAKKAGAAVIAPVPSLTRSLISYWLHWQFSSLSNRLTGCANRRKNRLRPVPVRTARARLRTTPPAAPIAPASWTETVCLTILTGKQDYRLNTFGSYS